MICATYTAIDEDMEKRIAVEFKNSLGQFFKEYEHIALTDKHDVQIHPAKLVRFRLTEDQRKVRLQERRLKGSTRERLKAYNQKPEVIARRREYNRKPEVKKKKADMAKARRAMLSFAQEQDPTLKDRFLTRVPLMSKTVPPSS